MKRKLLFVCSEPVWRCRLGAHQRMQSMLKLLSFRFDVMKLAVGKGFSGLGAPEGWIVVDAHLGNILNNDEFHGKLSGLVRNNNIEIVYFNYYYFSSVASALPDDVVTVCDIHDVQHLRAKSIEAAGEAPEQITEEVELANLTCFDKLVSINKNETRYLESRISTPVATIPYMDVFHELQYKENRYPVFVAGQGKANRDGLTNIILPAVSGGVIAGPVLLAGGIGRFVDEDATGLCIPMGEFDNTEDVYVHASVSLAPLRFGSGLKIKVIESILHGVPVAGTGCAFDGIAELPGEVFFKFREVSDLYGLNDFVAGADIRKIREFAIEHYSFDQYIGLTDF